MSHYGLSERTRAMIQSSELSVRMLARELGISPTTVSKWRKRESVHEHRRGPRVIHSTVMSDAEEFFVRAFRAQTMLPLDDCLYALKPTIPSLTRSSMYRCFQRHGLSPLSAIDLSRTRPLPETSDSFSLSAGRVQANDGIGTSFIAVDTRTKLACIAFVGDQMGAPFDVLLGQMAEDIPYRVNLIHYIDIRDDWVQCIPVQFSSEERARSGGPDNGCRENVLSRIASSPVFSVPEFSCSDLEKLVRAQAQNYNFSCKLKALNGATPMARLQLPHTSLRHS